MRPVRLKSRNPSLVVRLLLHLQKPQIQPTGHSRRHQAGNNFDLSVKRTADRIRKDYLRLVQQAQQIVLGHKPFQRMFLQPDLIRSRITILIRLLLSHLIKAASKQRFGPGHPTVQITAGLPQIVAVIVHSIVCVPLERRSAAVQRDDRHKEQIPVHLRLGMRVESLKPLTLRSRSLLPPDIFLVQRTVPPRGIQIIHQLSQAGLTIGNERIVR